MDQLSVVQLIAIWILPILFAVTLHEAAHGFVAHRLGDSTAYMLGRVTLNPIKHIDLVGTIIVPLVLLVTTHFVFGWAKPVPVNYHNLRKPRRDMAIVAVAGPVSNFVMALFWLLILKLGIVFAQADFVAGKPLIYMGQAGVIINIVLMVLNLIPIPPLDGSRVVSAALPPKIAYYYDKAAPFGLIAIIGLAVTGVLTTFLMGPVNVVQRFLVQLII